MGPHINFRAARDTRAILDAIRRIVRALRVSSRLAERRIGLSGAQLFVLQKLAEEPSLSLNELAARTLTHQSSVSVVVSRLVDAGLVSRSTSRSDQRRVVLSLSTKGRALVRNSPDAAQHRLISAIEALPAKKRRSLALQLEALVRRAGIGGEEAALFFEEGPPAVSASRRKGVLHREPA